MRTITHVALKSRVVMDGGAAIMDCLAVWADGFLYRLLMSCMYDSRNPSSRASVNVQQAEPDHFCRLYSTSTVGQLAFEEKMEITLHGASLPLSHA